MTILVYRHGKCMDGLGAAAVLEEVFQGQVPPPGAVHLEATYGAALPLVTSGVEGYSWCYFVDFCPSPVQLEELHEKMGHPFDRISVIDHHKTALEMAKVDGVEYVLDEKFSGCGLAYDWLWPHEDVPWWVSYIQDRDLWKFELPHSKAVAAAMRRFLRHKPEAFLLAMEKTDVVAMAAEGKIALEHQQSYIELVVENAREATLDGLRAWGVNTCIFYSEVADLILYERPDSLFCFAWWQRDDGKFQFSLRSRGGFDVSELAKKFGGGGHRNAAGFELDELPW